MGWKYDSHTKEGPDKLMLEIIGDVWMTVECKKYSVDLSAYFDGELEGEDLSRMETHLATCDNCRAGLDKLTLLRSAMTSISQSPVHRRSVLDDLKAKLKLGDKDEPESGPVPS